MELLTNLQAILRAAAEGLAAIPAAELDAKPDPNRWSKKEILGHLIDSAYNNHQRFVRADPPDHLRFAGYDQDEWVRRNAYRLRPAEEVVATFFTVHHHLAYVIASVRDDLLHYATSEHDFHRIAMRRVPAGEPRSLGFLIEDYLYHLVHHLRQVIPGFAGEWYSGFERPLPPT